MAITRIGVQPVVASAGQAAGKQTYRVGAVSGDAEALSLEVSCINDLSIEGNRNIVHWQGDGSSYRIYKAEGGVFGLIGTVAADLFIDDNITPDTAQPPPEG